ncbi:hypothetical protein WICMUC_002536 [Wickerhamomyces mucosus]|uniref:Pet127-domain-containing protein n=1 Tax=Wickerhamomyces mucosus TaxID=1378264 RepID=A0A9P8PQM6_9ASCO|nr:hypothetical protein WICMUC_002536 [Wickerhamomyces mucosus]
MIILRYKKPQYLTKRTFGSSTIKSSDREIENNSSIKESSIPFSLQEKVTKQLEKLQRKRKENKNNRHSSSQSDSKKKNSSVEKSNPYVPPSIIKRNARKASQQTKKQGYDFKIPSNYHREFDKRDSTNNNNDKFVSLNTIQPNHLNYNPIEVPNQDPVPTLKHKLSRVLFSPGIHVLQDPRTKVYNFNPYLSKLLPNEEFDFNKISSYIPSSKDTILNKLSNSYGAKYYSSTSSMTGLLSQLHFFISNFRPVNLVDFSKNVQRSSYGHFSRSTKLPASVIVKKASKGNVYAIDSDKSTDREMILSLLGHSLERLLTFEPEEYEKFKVGSNAEIPKESNTYHYSQIDSFILRSQLDAYDSRLPGTGTFDLKTRAVCAVRYDVVQNETNLTGYQLNQLYGRYESFESELLDLCKSTMIKYGLQARIGNMDGIFLAFHNISQMFGFQYLPLEKIDEIIHSFGLKDMDRDITIKEVQENPEVLDRFENKTKISKIMADKEFKISIKILNELLSVIQKNLPMNSNFRLVLATEKINSYESKLKCVATVITQEEIEELQTKGSNLKKIVDFQNEALKNHLDDHLKSIKNLNKRISKQNQSVGYEVFVKHSINGKYIDTVHPILNHPNDEWNVSIKINKMNQDDLKPFYERELSKKLDLLVENFEDINNEKDVECDEFRQILRLFGEKGKKTILTEENSEVIWNK